MRRRTRNRGNGAEEHTYEHEEECQADEPEEAQEGNGMRRRSIKRIGTIGQAKRPRRTPFSPDARSSRCSSFPQSGVARAGAGQTVRHPFLHPAPNTPAL